MSQLQTMLNQQGYNLKVDGIFGDQTAAAVRQYQQTSGLSVDGIVGTQTWGALTGGGGGGSAGGTYTTFNPAYTFDSLMANLDKQSYTPLTDAQILDQAKNRYDPIFNQDKLSATQAHDKTLLALDQQLAALVPAFDRQRETTAAAYDKARSNSDRTALSRGMQRSSYNAQTLANIDKAGARAQDDIGAEQVRQENNINQNKALNTEQLAQYIRQLETDYQRNLGAYQDAIRDKDYDRAMQAKQYANELEMYLFEASRQQEQWQAEFSENQRQFNQSLAASKSGGGGSGQTKKTDTKPGTTTADTGAGVGGFIGNLYGKGIPLTSKRKSAVGGRNSDSNF